MEFCQEKIDFDQNIILLIDTSWARCNATEYIQLYRDEKKQKDPLYLQHNK